jgi:hypothetical protein
MAISRNLYSVNDKLAAHAAELGELGRAVKQLQAATPIPGPQGRPGRDGSDCQCRNGKDGLNGAPGKDGRDAVGSQGPQGVSGRDGKDSIANPERVANLETSVRELRAENDARKAEIADLKWTLQSIIDRDKNTGEYLEWLRSKAAARAHKTS